MKKSLITAVCVGTMLAGATAFANDYSVIHPFSMPGKGEFFSVTTYMHTDAKFKDDVLNRQSGSFKVDTIGENLFWGLSDKWSLRAGYGHSNNKAEKNGTFKNWYEYLGANYLFKDDGKTFCKGSFSYTQSNNDSFDKTHKLYELFVTYGKHLHGIDPYVNVTYSNTLNLGKENDGFGILRVGAYKELSAKWGVNLVAEYECLTDETKEKCVQASLDFRYAFNKKSGVALGYTHQFSDSQDEVGGFNGELKRRNTFYTQVFLKF